MPSNFTMKVYEELVYYTGYFGGWQNVIAQTLRGSLETSKVGGSNVFEDTFSGLEVTVSNAGGFVTSIQVTGPVNFQGVKSTPTLVDIAIGAGEISTTKLLKAFNSYHDTSGASNKLANLLDDASFDITTIDTLNLSGPFHYGHTLKGGKNDDVFTLSEGGNTVFATGGTDEYDATAGTYDTIDYSSFRDGIKMTKSGAVRMVEKKNGDIDTLDGFESLTGSEGNDILRVGLGNMPSQIYGGSGNDAIGGGGKADMLTGGEGNDILNGRGGDDLLIGGGGNDSLNGGKGNDVLFSSDGYGYSYQAETDKMKGGKGSDLFVIEAPGQFGPGGGSVLIRDFRDGVDFIGLIGQDFGYFDYGAPGSDNLVFGDLSFSDSTDGAVISRGTESLAVLKNVMASQLDRSDFVELVDISREMEQYWIETDEFAF